MALFDIKAQPNVDELIRILRREGGNSKSHGTAIKDFTPSRVHNMELFLDVEIQEAVAERFRLLKGLRHEDPYYHCKRNAAVMRFLGYDHVFSFLDIEMPLFRLDTADTAALPRAARSFQDEHHGPIMSWEDFEKYPWPDVATSSFADLDWYQENLPEDMCIIPSGTGWLCEHITWLMGYETLCYALFDQRDLVKAISDRLVAIARQALARVLSYSKVKAVWGHDDMGFKTGTLISPADLREFVLPGHKMLAKMAHDAGRPYLLHSCGQLSEIMPDLIDDVGIDAKHSFEDTILPVADAKRLYGEKITLLGGIDMNFICTADEPAIRRRVRRTLDACMPGGGYCLGTGNSVANYIPLDNYLVMLDEGRRWGR